MYSNQLYLKFRGPKKGKFKLKCLSRLHCYSRRLECSTCSFLPTGACAWSRLPVRGGSEGETAQRPPHPRPPTQEPCYFSTAWRGRIDAQAHPPSSRNQASIRTKRGQSRGPRGRRAGGTKPCSSQEQPHSTVRGSLPKPAGAPSPRRAAHTPHRSLDTRQGGSRRPISPNIPQQARLPH